MDTGVLLEASRKKMQHSVDHMANELHTLHTGKATPTMVENIAVDAYGSHVRLKEMAAITIPDARTIQIQPWDRNMIQPIEKAIMTANIGLMPTTTGPLIRCMIPEMSGDRRKELTRVAHNMAEEGRIGVRAARQEMMTLVKQAKKEGHLGEDEMNHLEKEIQKQTDRVIAEISHLLAQKEKELLTF
ncbi:MAG: ribosome recycling factor [Puniceicoccales bacterium]|jgi:ribosome recycling factor|nr:ribosome recycling factor [Puniceicoccales bacterium]